jgi:hypothetical protein
MLRRLEDVTMDDGGSLEAPEFSEAAGLSEAPISRYPANAYDAAEMVIKLLLQAVKAAVLGKADLRL